MHHKVLNFITENMLVEASILTCAHAVRKFPTSLHIHMYNPEDAVSKMQTYTCSMSNGHDSNLIIHSAVKHIEEFFVLVKSEPTPHMPNQAGLFTWVGWVA